MLAQRRHLADLGLAVSKINHDLRNILASAQLFSDRIGAADDPVVKRFAPKMIGAIDRAIEYTRSVLAYGQAKEEPPRRQLLSLSRLVDDVADVLALPGHERVHWENRVAAGVEVDGDPEQLFRVLMNLCRNALEAVGDAVPGRSFRPLCADMESLDRRVEDDVLAEAGIERDDVRIGIGDRLEPGPVARRRHRRDLLRSLSVCHRTHRRGSYRRCQERSAIHHGSFLRAEIYTRFETDYGVVSRILCSPGSRSRWPCQRAAAQDDRFADAASGCR